MLALPEAKEHQRKKNLEHIAGSIAIAGVLGGLFFLSPEITGNAIADLNSQTNSFIGVGLLILGLIAGFFWLK